jgi:alpha-1,2-mannosyltransferase
MAWKPTVRTELRARPPRQKVLTPKPRGLRPKRIEMMEMNDANGFADRKPGTSDGGYSTGRPTYRHDGGVAKSKGVASALAAVVDGRLAGWARIERGWWLALGCAMVVFSAFPIANLVFGFSTKDYGLWYQVGLAVRQGLDIYPRPESHRLFPFMYPPSAAAMLAWLSMLGRTGSLLALVVVNSAAWLTSILLSVHLAVKPGSRRHPLVVILPSLCIIVLVHNIYLLGQPNLLLLALLLGAFACLQRGRSVAAGVLVATAAAIKAFPIMVLGYLVYRRMWAASVATVVALAAWLLIAPLPFRSPTQVVDDVVVWSKGMLFTYNSHGIAQRPYRSYSYKNQSIMALLHRLLRAVPADGEAVLSRRDREGQGDSRPTKGIAAIDPSTDLLAFLKAHAENSPNPAGVNTASSGDHGQGLAGPANARNGNAERFQRWEDNIQAAEPALRNAWKVNVLDLNFRSVTAVTLAAMLGLCGFVVAVLPRNRSRTPMTDAMEYAIVVLLTVMFSPLSFNYAYVWLIYPMTLSLHLVMSESSGARGHRMRVAWIAAVFLIPALALPMPVLAQAYGNLFLPALLLLLGLGAMLRGARRGGSDQETTVDSAHVPHGDHHSRPMTAVT